MEPSENEEIMDTEMGKGKGEEGVSRMKHAEASKVARKVLWILLVVGCLLWLASTVPRRWYAGETIVFFQEGPVEDFEQAREEGYFGKRLRRTHWDGGEGDGDRKEEEEEEEDEVVFEMKSSGETVRIKEACSGSYPPFVMVVVPKEGGDEESANATLSSIHAEIEEGDLWCVKMFFFHPKDRAMPPLPPGGSLAYWKSPFVEGKGRDYATILSILHDRVSQAYHGSYLILEEGSVACKDSLTHAYYAMLEASHIQRDGWRTVRLGPSLDGMLMHPKEVETMAAWIEHAQGDSAPGGSHDPYYGLKPRGNTVSEWVSQVAGSGKGGYFVWKNVLFDSDSTHCNAVADTKGSDPLVSKHYIEKGTRLKDLYDSTACSGRRIYPCRYSDLPFDPVQILMEARDELRESRKEAPLPDRFQPAFVNA